MNSRIYVGHVTHARIEPVAHRFRYPLYMFAVDVDELPALDSALRLFSNNRRGLFALHDGDYLGDAVGSLRDKLHTRIEAAGVDIALDRIQLVTMPRFAGHAFNPVSFYYCFDADDHVSGIVTEVNNTFGEGHVYVLPRSDRFRSSASDAVPSPVPGSVEQSASGRPESPQNRLRFRCDKRFHVSPFNAVDGAYDFDFGDLGEQLDIRIDIRHTGGKPFVSRVRGESRPLHAASLRRLALTYPFTAALTLPRIMLQAYKLHYRKGLPVHPKPAPSSTDTFRATRPAYISEFSAPPRPGLTETTDMKETHGSH